MADTWLTKAKRTLRRVANRALEPAGLRIATTLEDRVAATRYRALVAELHGCVTEFVFPTLPDRGRRIELLARLQGTQVSEAMYLIGYLQESLEQEGDVCEFGVAQGLTSALIANEIRETDRGLWLYDSFKGLSKPTQEDALLDDIFGLGSMAHYEGTMAFDASTVRERLKEVAFPESRLRITSGYIEDASDDDFPPRICFAYVDFDLYRPIKTALERIHSKLTSGGHAVVDDYGFFSTGVETAVAEFLATKGTAYELIVPPSFAGRFCVLKKT